MYNYRNQLSDVDIYPSYFYFWIFCSTLMWGGQGEVGGSPGRIQGRGAGGGKRKVTWEVGILKGREKGKKLDEIRQHRFNNYSK